jgi:pantoate--beta-alanine ligase
MQIIRTANEMNKVLSIHNNIGFVPTMGCLHEGHLSLLKRSLANNKMTVCSIFVNPAQFNDPFDFEKYPITLESDIENLTALNVDFLFLPSVEEIYPANHTTIHYDLGVIENIWEGKFRPGHFQGVCKVMDRLLHIIPATDLWMGQKDFQQCMVVEKLLTLTHRTNIQFHRVETIRNEMGLALSSRNERLSEAGKQNAAALYESLKMIRKSFKVQFFEYLVTIATDNLLRKGFEKVEYIDIIRTETELAVAAAAWIEGVRLIDNLILN